MSSLLDIDVSGAEEPKVVAADEEYKIRVLDATSAIDKNGEPYLLPRFEVVDEPLAKDFTKFLRLPHDGLNAKQLARAQWALKLFLEAFDMPVKGQIDVEDLKGKTGWAILGVEDNEQYGEGNYVKKFIAGK